MDLKIGRLPRKSGGLAALTNAMADDVDVSAERTCAVWTGVSSGCIKHITAYQLYFTHLQVLLLESKVHEELHGHIKVKLCLV